MNAKLCYTKFLIFGLLSLPVAFLFGNKAPSSAEAVESTDQWTVIGNIPVDEFKIQLHRAAGKFRPENTLESCEYAWELGTIPEVDLRPTGDGIIVAFHDRNFKRVVKDADPKLEGKGVIDFTFAELQELDVGAFRGDEFAGQRIPRIEPIFEAMRGRPEREIYLDIKEGVDLVELAEIVKKAGVSRQIIFTTTHHDFIREWKALVPESQSLNWSGGSESRIEGRLKEARKLDFEGITKLQVHVKLNPDKESAEPYNLSREFLRNLGTELREQGILFQALPWNLAEPEIFKELLDLGVASFATDFPEETVKAVRDYYAERGS